jgi:DnaJ-class molecular chaperone
MPVRTANNKDYYGILGIDTGASAEEIRKTYRRLAFQWHPDRNAGNPQAAERFKDISEAYAVLMDPAKRHEYDLSRQAGSTYRFRYNQEDIFRDLFTNPMYSSVFEELAREFERMGMRVDRQYFQQTLFGGRTVVTGGIFVISPFSPVIAAFRMARAALRGMQHASAGTAARTQVSSKSEGVLSGLGRLGRWLLGVSEPDIPKSLPADVNLTLQLTKVEAEQGTQKKVSVTRGTAAEEILVKVPPGVHSGTRLRLRGKGATGTGGMRGDLYLAVVIHDR